MREVNNWYVVHTKPKFERRAAELLHKKQIPVYLPQMSKLQYLLGRKRVIHTPLIPSLLFVFSSEETLPRVLSVEGVTGILYKFQKPATIRSRDIETMQRFLVEHTDVVIEKVPLGYTGETIHYSSDIQYNGSQKNDHHLLKVFLPSIGYCLTAQLEEVVLTSVA